MAKLLGPAFLRKIAIAGTLVALAGSTRVSLKVVESMVFTPAPIDPVYLGPSARADKYLGTRTDAQIYLGVSTLF